MFARWPLLLVISAALLSWASSLTPVIGMETDFFWHLAAGQRLWELGLELKDPYSFTHPLQEWVRIDWLFQWCSFGLYRLGGFDAILVCRSLLLLGAAGFLLAALRLRRLSWESCWLAVTLAQVLWNQGVTLRPATVSIFFTMLVLWLLEMRRSRPGWGWWLLPIMAVWFNLHVAALGGLLLIGLYSFSRSTWPQLLACSLVVFLNPQGWKLVYYPIHFLLIKSEWNRIILEAQPPGWASGGTALTRVLLLLALLASLKRWRTDRLPLLLTLVFGYLVLSVYRHQIQFAGLVVYLAAPALAGLALPLWVRPAALLAALRSGLLIGLLGWPPQSLIRRESFAESVADGLAAQAGPVRLFCDMNSAGYFLWRGQGRLQVFIDSRTDQVYVKPNFLGAYFEILLGRPQALPLLQSFQVEAVVNNRLSAGDSPLFAQLLPRDPDWKEVYSDNIAQLFARSPLAAQLPAPRLQAYLLHYNQARQALSQGHWPEAQAALERSLADYPCFASACQSLAQVHQAQQSPAEARRWLARAQLYNPHNQGLEQDWARLGLGPPILRQFLLPFWAF